MFTARYGLVAYTQQIAFSVYSAVRTDCLHTADCVWCLQRGTDCLILYSRLPLVFTGRYGLIACIQQIVLVFAARYGLIAYIWQIAFIL